MTCNQNIISNKFNLKLVTTFSSYWCTAIFTKSRSLHYVLKKQRKSISSEQNWRKERCFPKRHEETTTSEQNDAQIHIKTEERNDAFRTTRRNNDVRKKNDAQNSQSTTRISVSNTVRMTLKGTTLPNDTQKNIKTRKKNDAQRLADLSKDLKNHRSLNKRN